MIKVYDLNMQLVAYLENAFAIGYEQRMNELWTANFSLPANDPKNAECLPLRFVELFDAEERLDLFRIIPTQTERSADGMTVEYQCEHVLATLIDDVLFQYHQIGGVGIPTTQSLQYVLDQQATERWQLGMIDFAYEYEYKWENENLLGGIFAIPKPFIDAYHWTWDTTTTPWTLNLVEPESIEPSCYIRYGKNLQGIIKEEDPTFLFTRIYPLGYGEGINQLKIDDVNGGISYIDADTIGTYGVISRIYTDKTMENADTLKAKAQAILEGSKIPRITYSVDAGELYQLTEDPLDKFVEGALVRVIDDELGIDVTSRVVAVSKSDVIDQPWGVKIQIANKTEDIASSIADLENRQRINDVYAQGATNLDSHDFADNADPTHPAIIRFYIPEETVRINKIMLSYETSNFRAYSKGALGGGGATVSSAGGGASTATSSNGGSSTPTSSSGGGETLSFNARGSVDYGTVMESSKSFLTSQDDGGSDVGHIHKLYDFSMFTNSHDHTVNVPAHSHDVDIPSHIHNVDLPSHIHDIDYGIYLRSPAPSAVVITVDGNTVPLTASSGSNIDIIPYLALDGDGKITRDTWHELNITPNDLGRIVANVVEQIFVQSRGGGNF